MREQDIHELVEVVKERTATGLHEAPMFELASLDWLQGQLLEVVQAVMSGVVPAWKEVLFERAKGLFRECPGCGRARKWRWRRTRRLKVSVIGLDFEVDSPIVECKHCDVRAVNVVKLLTGLRSSDCSTGLELLAGYRGALTTYAQASHDLKVHHGQEIERTKLRRMCLEIEKEGLSFAEQQRQSVDNAQLPEKGADCLVIEADGGSVRTGPYVPCNQGDEGYGKTSASRGLPRRKRLIQNREVITMDARAPGEMSPRALESMVPAMSPKGERGRRMMAMAARAGRGEATKMRGLGDMGSGLQRAFDDAFGRPHFWCGDWKHLTDYVEKAAAVLVDFDSQAWEKEVKDGLWYRHREMVDLLLSQAFGHLPSPLASDLDKCPVHGLQTYVNNNWDSFRSKQMKSEGLPFVSARAESQVRDRTRTRFGGPGTWLEENLEPKATMQGIILEGSWAQFEQWAYCKREGEFRSNYADRWRQARLEKRVTRTALVEALAQPSTAKTDAPGDNMEDHDSTAIADAA